MNKFLIYNDKVKKFENIINNYTLAFHITNILPTIQFKFYQFHIMDKDKLAEHLH